MSNTIRRKSRKISPNSWVLWDWDTRIGFMQYAFLDPRAAKGKKAIAKYHSDAGVGDLWFKSGCKWMRRVEHKKHDRKCEQALHRYFSGIDEDVILPTRKHDWLD